MAKILTRISQIRKSVRVRDIMSADVIALDKNDSVYDAVIKMSEKSISTIVICEGKKPTGILTERDLVSRILLKEKNPRRVKISDVMTKNLIVIDPDSPILKAGNLMRSKKVRKLIVCDRQGCLMGIITQTDIIKSLNRINEEYNFLLANPLISVFFIAVLIIMMIISILVRR